MGIAIAEALSKEGASVTLVLGPTDLKPDNEHIKVVSVTTAQEMYAECSKLFPETDIAVLAAAVADYRPKIFSATKIKKQGTDLTLELTKTVDIAASLGSIKSQNQLLIGFALETNNEAQNALLKLEKKNLDFIVLNSMQDQGAGFGHDTNKVTIIHRNGRQTEFPMKSKKEVAADIVSAIIQLVHPKQSAE
jgi:phosphopantothenoylcysteine decarboxylase/phosphopantothenate--cysteine ligase